MRDKVHYIGDKHLALQPAWLFRYLQLLPISRLVSVLSICVRALHLCMINALATSAADASVTPFRDAINDNAVVTDPSDSSDSADDSTMLIVYVLAGVGGVALFGGALGGYMSKKRKTRRAQAAAVAAMAGGGGGSMYSMQSMGSMQSTGSMQSIGSMQDIGSDYNVAY